MPEQTEKTRSELQEHIIKEVRLRPRCEGFGSIGVHPLVDGQISRENWDVAGVNYGGADEASCDAALSEIVPHMKKQYRFRS
jgi:hypothetical protein